MDGMTVCERQTKREEEGGERSGEHKGWWGRLPLSMACAKVARYGLCLRREASEQRRDTGKEAGT